MSLFNINDIGGTLQNVAKKSGELAHSAVKKSGELVEITKLNIKIKENETNIKKNFEEIGQLVFEQYKTSGIIPLEFKDHIYNIENKQSEIIEIRNNIEKIKKEKNIDSNENIFKETKFEIID